MTSTTPLLNSQRKRLLLALIVLFGSFYMLTYSGRVESGDSLSLLDAASSLVQFGDGYLDLSAWFNPPQAYKQPEAFYPLQYSTIEPLPVILSAPLFWLAQNLPGIGLVHAVWLLNIVISAAAVGVLFLYSVALGYSEQTAILCTVLFGVATILWPYSKSLFREPLLLLMLLLAALFLECWRTSRYRSRRLFVLGVLAFVGATLTKESALLALPALLVIALPRLGTRIRSRRWRHVHLALLMIAAVVLIFVAYAPRPALIASIRYFIPGEVRLVPAYLQSGIHTYLFSIGGSIWGTSPVVLLALPGCWLLWRRDERRYVWVIVLMVAAFSAGHAILRGQHWFGGLSWPPRFLVPVIPFLMIGTLPVLDRIARRQASVWPLLLTAALTMCGLWIQFNGVSLWWGEYAGALPPASNQVLEWSGGLNELQYLRWVVTPGLWATHPLDFAWVRTEVIGWPLVFSVLAIVSAILLWRLLRRSAPGENHRRIPVIKALLLIWLAAVWLGLRAIYADPLYLGGNNSLHAILPIIQAQTRPGDVVLLSSEIHDPSYERFFINYSKIDTGRIVALPQQPGERTGPELTPRVVSENPDALLTNLTVPLIHVLASTRERLWLLIDSGPFITWNVRPVERFMAIRYYPVREISTDPPDPEVRLLEYLTIPAPDPFGFRGPEALTDLTYGNMLQLAGYTLPSGSVYEPGQGLPISLYWQAIAPLDRDYTIAWFLADASNAVVAQGMDSYPMGGFAPTSQWQVGVPVWDNRALWLPDTLQAGNYRLWVKIYTFDEAGFIQDLPVTGETVVEESIGVLPTKIEVIP